MGSPWNRNGLTQPTKLLRHPQTKGKWTHKGSSFTVSKRRMVSIFIKCSLIQRIWRKLTNITYQLFKTFFSDIQLDNSEHMYQIHWKGRQPQGPITITTKATNISTLGSKATLQLVLVHGDVKVWSLQRTPFQAVITALERKISYISLLVTGNLTICASTGKKRC